MIAPYERFSNGHFNPTFPPLILFVYIPKNYISVKGLTNLWSMKVEKITDLLYSTINVIKNSRVFIFLLRKNDYQQKAKRTYELQLVVM